ncbi:MAG: AAA family ATPase [Caulobacter sp.]|nr:AAA family ATPase [Caulobacter sp.]
MPHKYSIHGFRSLLDFEIDLRAGINVLVGTNGTGKSNFISFLDFLGEMIEADLNRAIAVAQGAGSVFSKESFSEDQANLNFSVSGDATSKMLAGRFYYSGDDDEKNVGYIYDCTISYVKSIPAVFIAKERLRLKIDGSAEIDVRRFTTRESGKFVTRCEFADEDHPLLREIFSWDEEVKKNKAKISDKLANFVRPEFSVLRFLGRQGVAFATVFVDLARFRSVNIDPTAARRPTPVSTQSELKPSGEGLAGALYSIERGSYYYYDPYLEMKRYRTSDEQIALHGQVMSWCREVNDQIEGVKVVLEFEEAQFKPFMRFRIGGHREEFPLTRVSDGTVKWLALVTILHVEDRLSIIEEPENFLHPFMQEAFLALCRQLCAEDELRSIVITTHSPTLLDCCAPKELTIFEVEDGKSHASKVANSIELAEKIRTSRFGLGYYYRTGGVYGEDRSAR